MNENTNADPLRFINAKTYTRADLERAAQEARAAAAVEGDAWKEAIKWAKKVQAVKVDAARDAADHDEFAAVRLSHEADGAGRVVQVLESAAASSPLPAEPPDTCLNSLLIPQIRIAADGEEPELIKCEVCDCSEYQHCLHYCVEHHKVICTPFTPAETELIIGAIPLQALPAPAQPEGEQEVGRPDYVAARAAAEKIREWLLQGHGWVDGQALNEVAAIITRHLTAPRVPEALSRASKLCRSTIPGARVELIFQNLKDAQAVHRWLCNAATPSPETPVGGEASYDQIVQAITDIEGARESHVQWAAHLRLPHTFECQGCVDHAAHIGDADYHDEWIAKYDNVINVLFSINPFKGTTPAKEKRP